MYWNFDVVSLFCALEIGWSWCQLRLWPRSWQVLLTLHFNKFRFFFSFSFLNRVFYLCEENFIYLVILFLFLTEKLFFSWCVFCRFDWPCYTWGFGAYQTAEWIGAPSFLPDKQRGKHTYKLVFCWNALIEFGFSL